MSDELYMRPLFWHIFTSEQALKNRKEEKANNFWVSSLY